MAITPTIQASQASVTTITDGETSDILISQAFITSVANFPTERIDSSQFFVTTLTSGATSSVEVSQSFITVVARGAVADPKVRVWTFTLDGHDMYVLRLGNTETLVYDTLSEMWYVWGSNEADLWKAYNGQNWLGAEGLADIYGSNVVVGDDANGSIYFLDPNGVTDDDPVGGSELPREFPRRVMSGSPTRGYGRKKVFSVQLEGSIGKQLSSDDTVTLSYSDDRGISYVTAGAIAVPEGDYHTRIDWRSLGSYKAPGRLYRIEDRGSLKRIDSLTLLDDSPEG